MNLTVRVADAIGVANEVRRPGTRDVPLVDADELVVAYVLREAFSADEAVWIELDAHECRERVQDAVYCHEDHAARTVEAAWSPIVRLLEEVQLRAGGAALVCAVW